MVYFSKEKKTTINSCIQTFPMGIHLYTFFQWGDGGGDGGYRAQTQVLFCRQKIYSFKVIKTCKWFPE
jgi:hypothetical protein